MMCDGMGVGVDMGAIAHSTNMSGLVEGVGVKDAE